MLKLNKDTLFSLISFESVNDMDDSLRHHRAHNALSPTEWDVLSILARHSCVHVGVSYLAKSTIAEQVGKSRRTVIRVCKRLESLGIIEQHEARRVRGDRRQTSNIIVIQPFERDEDKPEEKADGSNDTPEMSRHEASSIKLLNNTYKQDTATIPSQALKNSLPKEIYDALSRYFNAEEIYEYYGLLLRAKRRIKYDLLIEEYPNIYVDTIHSAVFKHKRGRVRNFASYLYSAFESATSATVRKIAEIEGRLIKPAWLSSK